MFDIVITIVTFLIAIVAFIAAAVCLVLGNDLTTDLFLCSIASMMICNRYAEGQ